VIETALERADAASLNAQDVTNNTTLPGLLIVGDGSGTSSGGAAGSGDDAINGGAGADIIFGDGFAGKTSPGWTGGDGGLGGGGAAKGNDTYQGVGGLAAGSGGSGYVQLNNPSDFNAKPLLVAGFGGAGGIGGSGLVGGVSNGQAMSGGGGGGGYFGAGGSGGAVTGGYATGSTDSAGGTGSSGQGHASQSFGTAEALQKASASAPQQRLLLRMTHRAAPWLYRALQPKANRHHEHICDCFG
jgi:hypothetical protein